VSASYISAIETARNSTTGRAPEPSISVADKLLRALELSPELLVTRCARGDDSYGFCNHMLLYRLSEHRGGLKPVLDQLFDGVGSVVLRSRPRK